MKSAWTNNDALSLIEKEMLNIMDREN